MLDEEIAADLASRVALDDRIAAMEEMRSAALRVAQRLRRAVTFDDVRKACESDADVERFELLVDRITGSRDGSGSDAVDGEGYPLDRARADFGDGVGP